MKTVDHSYEQVLIMHDNVHIHVIMNISATPTVGGVLGEEFHCGFTLQNKDGYSGWVKYSGWVDEEQMGKSTVGG